MASPTPNKSMTYPAHGGAVNAWDTPINADFDQLDLNLGGEYAITFYSSVVAAPTYNSTYAVAPSTGTTVTLPTSLAQNLYYNVTGTIAGDQSIVWPSGLGAILSVNNASSGAFSVTMTPGGGGTSYAVTQGGSSILISDGTNIVAAGSNQVQVKLDTYFGDPNGNVAGTAAVTNGGNTDAVWDATNRQLFVATLTGNAAAAVWSPQIARLVPEGYLTGAADANNPIITVDTTATTIQYVPYQGNWMLLSNGTILYPYQFSALLLYLTASQAANQIYDMFAYANPTVGIISPIIGTGPAWSVATPGSCSRGTGAGTTQITRSVGGRWTNAVTMNLTSNPTGSGNTVTSIGANQGVYLGSIFIDSTAGQVTCHISYGQNRKWGISNPNNRETVSLRVADPTASWTYATNTIRATDGAPAAYSANSYNFGSGTVVNGLTVFNGLAEENADLQYTQMGSAFNNAVPAYTTGFGLNSTTAFVAGAIQAKMITSGGGVGAEGWAPLVANYTLTRTLGINNITMLEVSGASNTLLGTYASHLMTAKWEA